MGGPAVLGGTSRPRRGVMARDPRPLPRSLWGAHPHPEMAPASHTGCWGQKCHHPAVPVCRSPGSGMEIQAEVPGHLAQPPHRGCRLPAEQKEVTVAPSPPRPTSPITHPLTSHPLPRARRLLFPPLPKPVGSKAIQFAAGEMSQVRCRVQEGPDPAPQQAPVHSPWHGTLPPPQPHPTLRASPGQALWNPQRISAWPSCC